MADLEHELALLQVEWPETPDLAAAVSARLREPASGPAPRGVRWPGWRLGLAYGAAVLLAGFALTMAVSPSARSAVLEWLGLKSARIERREPTATPAPTLSGGLGSGLGLGDRVTLAEAGRRAGFRPLVPAELGVADAVYEGDSPNTGAPRISLVYAAREGLPESEATGAGLLVQEFEAMFTPVIEKALGEGARAEQLTLDGAPAVFLSGEPHGFAYVVPETGNAEFEPQRLAGNTLLVEREDGLLVRIEGEVSRERAVEIYRSLR